MLTTPRKSVTYPKNFPCFHPRATVRYSFFIKNVIDTLVMNGWKCLTEMLLIDFILIKFKISLNFYV